MERALVIQDIHLAMVWGLGVSIHKEELLHLAYFVIWKSEILLLCLGCLCSISMGAIWWPNSGWVIEVLE